MRHILYIDDEDDIREVAGMAIEMGGEFQVETLGAPKEAVAEASRINPDLILLDFRMPEMDGLAVLRALRAEPSTSAIPVVFMTASVQKHELQSLLDAGALGVIEKPFDPMTLSDQVRDYLADA